MLVANSITTIVVNRSSYWSRPASSFWPLPGP